MMKLGIHTLSGLPSSSDMTSSLNIYSYLLKFAWFFRCLAGSQRFLGISEAVLTWQQAEIQGNTLGDVSGPSYEWDLSLIQN